MDEDTIEGFQPVIIGKESDIGPDDL